MTILLLVILLAVAAFGYFFWSRQQTIKTLLATPLTDHQRTIIADQVPLIRRLPADVTGRLEGKVQRFLHQIEFIGCNDLEVTEEMELSIAAQASLLVVNSDTWYKNLRTILIYPGAFKSRQSSYNGYVLTERETVRTGESWARGPVVLSWAHSEQGAANDRDGHNVVLHEFAHQIDDLSGQTNGVPILGKDHDFTEWASAFSEAYERHIQSIQSGRATVIDPYGAEGPEEFFAVSVEIFFEKPAELRLAEPAVYDQLTELFQLQPIEWG